METLALSCSVQPQFTRPTWRRLTKIFPLTARPLCYVTVCAPCTRPRSHFLWFPRHDCMNNVSLPLTTGKLRAVRDVYWVSSAGRASRSRSSLGRLFERVSVVEPMFCLYIELHSQPASYQSNDRTTAVSICLIDNRTWTSTICCRYIIADSVYTTATIHYELLFGLAATSLCMLWTKKQVGEFLFAINNRLVLRWELKHGRKEFEYRRIK